MELVSALWSLLCSCRSFTLLASGVAILALLFDVMKRRKKWSRYPPGPSPAPFLGNILQMDFTNPTVSFAKLRKQFGNIFSLQFGWTNVVVLNGFEVVKEALVQKSEDTADRPPIPIYKHLGLDKGVIIARYGHVWRDLRRFSLSTLRDFGLGKKSLEERVVEEAGHLCSSFESNEGRPFDPLFTINNAVSNVICSMTFGDRFEYDDEKFRKLLHVVQAIMNLETGLVTEILNAVPWLINIPGPHKKLFTKQQAFLDFIKEIMAEHKKSWDPAVRRDFIDAFLEEMEKNKEDPGTSFTEHNLLITTSDIFIAGTETSSTTLRWGLLMMILYPDIQRRVHEEIDKVIGRHRRVAVEDQVSMPFTNAVIHETQRYGDIVPLAVPHMAYRDTVIRGFFIPKGTSIVVNLTSVLKDETVWKNPLQFDPENFLDAENKFVKHEAFIPFSAGRRVCLGEQLAKMELFLFFTSLLQRFTFTIPRDQRRPSEEPFYAFTFSPHPYQICAQVR